jgi:hypothetical protein
LHYHTRSLLAKQKTAVRFSDGGWHRVLHDISEPREAQFQGRVGFRVWSSGFGVEGLGFRVEWFRVQDSGLGI